MKKRNSKKINYCIDCGKKIIKKYGLKNGK